MRKVGVLHGWRTVSIDEGNVMPYTEQAIDEASLSG